MSMKLDRMREVDGIMTPQVRTKATEDHRGPRSFHRIRMRFITVPMSLLGMLRSQLTELKGEPSAPMNTPSEPKEERSVPMETPSAPTKTIVSPLEVHRLAEESASSHSMVDEQGSMSTPRFQTDFTRLTP